MVLLNHSRAGNSNGILEPLGRHGVGLFFVLSGFLITTLLLRERERTGTINLQQFYLRRFFRLMPVAWLYLAVIAPVGQLSFKEALSCLFFFRAAVTPLPHHGLTDHFWSLSIEEDFYLFWGFALLFFGNKRAKLLAGAGAIVLGILAFHGGVAFELTNKFFRAPIMVGCVSAFIPRRKLPTALTWTAVAAFIGCIAVFHSIDPPLIEAVIVAFLLWNTSQGQMKFLNHWTLSEIGRASYSIYVWQQLATDIRPSDGWSYLPLRIALSLALGFASYYWLETPCRQFGARVMMRKKSQNRVLLSVR
jgi:peptidoglycan/LPS O-acetylase OafA/YrhL